MIFKNSKKSKKINKMPKNVVEKLLKKDSPLKLVCCFSNYINKLCVKCIFIQYHQNKPETKISRSIIYYWSSAHQLTPMSFSPSHASIISDLDLIENWSVRSAAISLKTQDVTSWPRRLPVNPLPNLLQWSHEPRPDYNSDTITIYRRKLVSSNKFSIMVSWRDAWLPW